MEQFLAYRKAKFAEQDKLASQALDTQSPVEAKAILNKLKNYNPNKWYEQVPMILAEGLREKFRQNQYLLEILINTRGLKLGEASKDTKLGIGMTLTDPQVLDVSKWNKEPRTLTLKLQCYTSTLSHDSKRYLSLILCQTPLIISLLYYVFRLYHLPPMLLL